MESCFCGVVSVSSAGGSASSNLSFLLVRFTRKSEPTSAVAAVCRFLDLFRFLLGASRCTGSVMMEYAMSFAGLPRHAPPRKYNQTKTKIPLFALYIR